MMAAAMTAAIKPAVVRTAAVVGMVVVRAATVMRMMMMVVIMMRTSVMGVMGRIRIFRIVHVSEHPSIRGVARIFASFPSATEQGGDDSQHHDEPYKNEEWHKQPLVRFCDPSWP